MGYSIFVIEEYESVASPGCSLDRDSSIAVQFETAVNEHKSNLLELHSWQLSSIRSDNDGFIRDKIVAVFKRKPSHDGI